MSSPSMIVMVVMCMGLLAPAVTASSSCLYYSTSTNRSIDLSPLSGRVITATIGLYVYSLYPCGPVSLGFCSNPNMPSISPTFFCQYDIRYVTNNTLAYQMDNSTQVQNVTTSNNSINVVYQSGHLCRDNPRIANITYTCSCQSNNTILSVIESPTCTYNAVVQSPRVCSSFGIICPVTPTTAPPTSTPAPTTSAPTRPSNNTNTTTSPPTIPTPTTAPTSSPTSPPSRSCTSDSSCTGNYFCNTRGFCQLPIDINGHCSLDLRSRRQCAGGACYINSTCVPLIPNGDKCNNQVYYPCFAGNYCNAPVNNTWGTCQKQKSNGESCTSDDACDSGYCDPKSGTCQVHPIAQLIAAAALSLVAIILIALGGCVFMGVSICCCCYRFWKPRPVVVHHHEPVHVQQYHAPYRQLQDGYTRV